MEIPKGFTNPRIGETVKVGWMRKVEGKWQKISYSSDPLIIKGGIAEDLCRPMTHKELVNLLDTYMRSYDRVEKENKKLNAKIQKILSNVVTVAAE
jgi:hypothetical protein